MNNEVTHEQALRWNKAFDTLSPWRQYHPRTFWTMVEAVADILPPDLNTLSSGTGTGTVNIASFVHPFTTTFNSKPNSF